MTSADYPIFTGGQKLTAAELNQGTSFLDARDHDLGRAIGFGIACGLTGGITGATVTISPGIAVDQSGAAIVVRTPLKAPLTTQQSDTNFEFIDSSFPGLTLILTLQDTKLSVDDCADSSGDDCAGKSDTHRRSTGLMMVKGRLIDRSEAFTLEPLLNENVISISKTGTYQGDPTSLRIRIAERLMDASGVADSTIAQLQQISFPASDLAGVKAYKATFINEVLFRTLALLRCQALSKVACVRDDISAVVLGYSEKKGTNWGWHGEYRHEWEPPTGVSQALQGGSSATPCALWINHLTGWIGTYRPPEPPTTPGPASSGTPQVNECSHVTYLQGWQCGASAIPLGGIPFDQIRDIPDALREIFERQVPDFGPPTLPDPRRVMDPIFNGSDVYGTQPLDDYGQGRWVVGELLGHTADVATRAISVAFEGAGLNVRTDTISMEGAAKLADFEITSVVTPSDHMYLVVDSNNVVQATGRVAVSHDIARIGTALPHAVAVATDALAATTALSQHHVEFSESLTQMGTELAQIDTIRDDFTQLKGDVEHSISNIDQTIQGRISSLVGEQLSTFQQRISTVEGSLNVLSRTGGVQFGEQVTGVGRAIDRPAATALIEVVESFNQALSEVEPKGRSELFERYRGDAARASGKLEAVIDTNDAGQFNLAMLEVLDTLRTATKSAGITTATATQLDAQYRIVKGMLR